jgi:hypothetical protein
MPVKKSKPYKGQRTIIERRRDAVAHYMTRGLTCGEIADKLADDGILNPETNAAYSVDTIELDSRALHEQWLENSKRSIEELRAQQLAELSQVKRAGWQDRNLKAVMSAITQESKLTDTLAPLRINVNLVSDLWDELERRGLNPEQVFKKMLANLTKDRP